MRKLSWRKGIACILCIALLLPTLPTMAAGDAAPTLTLLCPTANSANVDGQKLILRSSLPVVGQANATISIAAKDNAEAAVFSIAANSDAITVSDSEPHLITLALSALKNGDTAFTPVAGTAYTVTVSAGAFLSIGANKPCAEMHTDFTLVSGADDSVLVTYALPDGWSVKAVGDTASIACGASVASGASLAVTGNIPEGYAAVGSVNGTAVSDLSSIPAGGYTHIVVTLQKITLSGSASIVNAAQAGTAAYTPAYGDTIKGVYTGSDIGSDTAHLLYAFSRGDTTLQSGASASYAIQKDDIGGVILLTISSSRYDGSVTATSGTVTKQTVAKPATPTIASSTDTSVTLGAVDGCEYSRDGTSFQSNPAFSGLTAGQGYTFFQRYAETDTAFASEVSTGLTTQLGQAALTGTVAISGTPRAGQTLTASLTDTNNTGTLTYNWYRDNALVSSGTNYTVATADIGKSLTIEVVSSVQTGKRTASTAVIGKTPVNAPGAPALAGSTQNSISLVSVAGCEYSLDNSNWQDSPTFGNLLSGQTYTFYQRYKATDMLEASAPTSASFATAAAQSGLTGTVTVSGDVRYGKTLVATLTGANSSGAPTYTWFRGATAVGTGTTYDVNSADIGYPLYVQVVCAGTSGGITKLVGTVQRAEYVGIAPTAPTRESRSTSRITLTPHEGYEYSRDGENWQSSNVFSGLSAGKTYKFYQRVAATASMDASPASEELKTSTSSSSSSSSGSSSSGSSSSGSSSGSSEPAADDNKPSGSGALYTYATTGESTRILFSTMERLVAGNKTQDITITSGNIQFRFFKGTMQLTEGTLWYDFGTELNGAELMSAAKAIAGDSVVATVHFNHSGELPAKANIRIALDASQAGKALYYYRIENGALTYIQTAIADISGAVTVVQSSCSDYVLLDRDFFAAEETPTPSPDPTPSPAPIAADTTEGGNSSSGGWFIVLIIIAALLLIVVGILFYLKSRQTNSFRNSFGNYDEYPDDDPDDDPYDPDDGGDFFDDDGADDQNDDYAEPLADVFPYDHPTGSSGRQMYTETLAKEPSTYAPSSATYAPQQTFTPYAPSAPAYTPQGQAPQYAAPQQAFPQTDPYNADPTPQPLQQETVATPLQPASTESGEVTLDHTHATSAHMHTPDVPGKYPRARYRP